MALIPEYRHEQFLDAIVNSTTPPSSAYRIELFLAKIAGEAVTLPTPVNRIELYLAKIAGENVTVPAPVTRLEMYLAAIAGEAVTPPDPEYRIEQWLYDWSQGGGQSELKYAAGSSPLTLANAVARLINTLTRMGTAEQATTPTPSAPVDIVCNNGAVKMVHTSGLPAGYKLLEYVGGTGTQYIVITGLKLASTDIVESEFQNATTTGYGALYGIYKTGESSALYANQTYYGYDATNNKVDTGIHVDTDWHTARHDFVNGTLTVDSTTVSFTPFEFTNATDCGVLTRYYNGSYGYDFKGNIRKFKVTRGNDIICDLIPAKNSSDEAGLYDLIGGNFYPATGGTLVEGNIVDDLEMRVVGTPEVLSVNSQTATVANLFGTAIAMDEHELISGVVTRKFGFKILDGTETIGQSSAYGTACYIQSAASTWGADKALVMCTHFQGEEPATSVKPVDTCFFDSSGHFYFRVTDNTVATFKQFLADQYAAGTPVIVMYQLATTQTESVAPQALRTATGTNTVTVTAPEVDQINTMMVVTYYGKL